MSPEASLALAAGVIGFVLGMLAEVLAEILYARWKERERR